MGSSISWIAFKSEYKQEVFRILALSDTGEPDETNEKPISGANFPYDWYVLFLNNFTHPFVSAKILSTASKASVILGCQIEEHVMFSTAFLYENGVRKWGVTHASEKGIYNIEIDGNPPEFFTTLQAQTIAAQDAEDGKKAEVDLIFDIPLALAERVCGFRHDKGNFEWGEPKFTHLRTS
jgi:hypothetical protein